MDIRQAVYILHSLPITQSCTLQRLLSTPEPGHPCPLPLGVGLVQVRTRSCLPPPHDLVHVVHSFHWLHAPGIDFSTTVKRFIMVITEREIKNSQKKGYAKIKQPKFNALIKYVRRDLLWKSIYLFKQITIFFLLVKSLFLFRLGSLYLANTSLCICQFSICPLLLLRFLSRIFRSKTIL